MDHTDTVEAIKEELMERLSSSGLNGIVIIEITENNEAISLDKIVSKKKGRGNAQRALSVLLSLADECCKDVMTIPHALSRSTRTDQLERWYENNGFERVIDSNGMNIFMRRSGAGIGA